MPTRILREGIVTSEKVNTLTWGSEVFYRRLMSIVDDYGRYFAHPSLLRAACFPLQLDRVSEADVKQMLSDCIAVDLLTLYSAGKYLQILKFRQQTRSKSKYPEPVDGELLSKCESNANQMCSETETESKANSETESKANSETESKAEAHLAHAPNREAHAPSWKEFWDYCQIHGGPVEWYALDKWQAAEQDNWKGKSNWQAYANRCRAWWENDGRPMTPPQRQSARKDDAAQRRAEKAAREYPEPNLKAKVIKLT